MDEPGTDHSQQTDTRTENETPHILTHRIWLRPSEELWTAAVTPASTQRQGERTNILLWTWALLVLTTLSYP